MTKETSFGMEGTNHIKNTPTVSFYKSKEHVRILEKSQFFRITLYFQGCRHQRYDDTLKRRRKQSMMGKHYSTWHDKVINTSGDIFGPFCTKFMII